MTDELMAQLAQVRPDTYAEGWAASATGQQALNAVRADAAAQPRRFRAARLLSLGRLSGPRRT